MKQIFSQSKLNICALCIVYFVITNKQLEDAPVGSGKW